MAGLVLDWPIPAAQRNGRPASLSPQSRPERRVMSKPWSGVPSRALGSDGAERAHPTAARIARVPRRFDFLPKVRSNLLRKLDSRVDKRPFSALERVLNAYRMAPECAPSGRRTRGFDAFPRGAVDLAEPSALSRRAGSAPPPGGLRPFTDSQPQKRSQALGRRRGASRAARNGSKARISPSLRPIRRRFTANIRRPANAGLFLARPLLAFEFGFRGKPEFLAASLWPSRLVPQLIGALADSLFLGIHVLSLPWPCSGQAPTPSVTAQGKNFGSSSLRLPQVARAIAPAL